MTESLPNALTQKLNPLRRGVTVLWRFVAPIKRPLILVSLFGVASALANGTVPYLMGRFFDGLVEIKGVESLSGLMPVAILLGAWLAVQCIANGVDWFNDRTRRRIDTQVRLNIRDTGVKHLLRLPVQFHRTERVAEVLEKFSKASWMCGVLVQSAVNLAPQLLSIVVGLLVSLLVNPYLALILLVGTSIYVAVMVRIVHTAGNALEEGMRAWSKGMGRANAAVMQAEAVKQATAEAHEESSIDENSAETFRVWYRTERIWTNCTAFQRIIVMLTQLCIFAVSIAMVARGVITPGELVALNGYSLMFFGPFVQLGQMWHVFQNGLAAAAEIEPVLALPVEPYQPAKTHSVSATRGTVDFRDVSFWYANKHSPILSDISFVARPGMQVALVGESGVGKSTFISLLSAYYTPSKGTVLVDGIDSREIDLMDLRSRIAVVPQEVALFNDSIAANIRYGAFDASLKDVERAAELAQIDGVIARMSDGYDTVVGERGVKLSVGQKQRVAIARAILRDPQILILDEPTSALDPKTERLVTESLGRLMEGRTTFIVAHRLSTVRDADKILVLDRGRVVEHGRHDSLIARDGIYRQLHDVSVGAA